MTKKPNGSSRLRWGTTNHLNLIFVTISVDCLVHQNLQFGEALLSPNNPTVRQQLRQAQLESSSKCYGDYVLGLTHGPKSRSNVNNPVLMNAIAQHPIATGETTIDVLEPSGSNILVETTFDRDKKTNIKIELPGPTTSPNEAKTSSTLTHLECSMCHKKYPSEELITMCPDCQRPLLARYNLDKAKQTLTKETLRDRQEPTLWRYEEVLPVQYRQNMLTLGEGWTMIHKATRLGNAIGCPNTYIKDESTNPTGSFKARGLALAVSRAKELGATSLSIPSAGNAAGAMTAYSSVAGLPSYVYMPKDVPKCFQTECRQLGANITLVDGLINDCGRRAKEEGSKYPGRFDVSTLKEPYRLEGKKTMGYELAEQFNWELPDVIIYPTGGGTGLVGMWKAFDEMERLGLIDPNKKRPRMVSVQSTGCAPIVKAFHDGVDYAELWSDAKTVADGLRVPVAVGDFMILQALRESNGTAIAVCDSDMIKYTKVMGSLTGIFPAPEGASCLAAQVQLLKRGWIQPDEKVLLFNTGTGLKYHHVYEQEQAESD